MSIRIIHTADLHFGKKLHGYDLLDQQKSYVNWLAEFILKNGISHLLVAGDVFDLANPSSDSMKVYYEMLKMITDLNCRIIITGGNHDSAALLNAPAELLRSFNIVVIGSAPEDVKDCIVEIKDSEKTIALVAAVPYLRDTDIRKSVSGETYADKLLAVKEGIKAYYERVAEYCTSTYPGVPVIATGHLYAAGSESSDSEREIQIGNLAGIDSGTFSEVFNYVALGHIHKPQQVGSQNRIYYSGSPYPLSFSERSQQKYIRIVEVNNNVVTSKQVEVPSFRQLVRFTGTLDGISNAIKDYNSYSVHPDLFELEVKEEMFDTSVLSQKEQLVSEVNLREDVQVIFSRVEFLNQPIIEEQSLNEEEELSPVTVFKSLISDQDEEKQMELLVAFAELTESLNGEEP